MSDPEFTVGKASEETRRSQFLRALPQIGFAIGVCVFLLLIIPAFCAKDFGDYHSAAMQKARQIGQVLFSCSTDNVKNGNAYPDGNSSTEVFQKLLDEGYCTEPELFYLPLPGKIKPIPGQKLKPENVGFDLTLGVEPNSPDGLPMVFTTGYRVSYTPGSKGIPLVHPSAGYSFQRSLLKWTGKLSDVRSNFMFSAVIFYKGNYSVNVVTDADGSIPNFISPDFKPDGKTYRQLTPDGPLP